MHELSLLENVRTILEEHARSQHFQIVENITLEIGVLSCVELDALTFAFAAVMKDSLAEYADLKFKRIEGQGRCFECGQLTPMLELYDVCAHCGHFRLEIVNGLEMKITELKVR
jgi:hydrogenase nickel incorporation protein HypA/HybF